MVTLGTLGTADSVIFLSVFVAPSDGFKFFRAALGKSFALQNKRNNSQHAVKKPPTA